MRIDIKDYMDELLYALKKRDSIKAKVLIGYFETIPQASRKKVIKELNASDNLYAIPLLSSIASEYFELCPPDCGLKESLMSKFMLYPDRLAGILREDSLDNIKFFIEIAGEIHCEDAIEPLIDILKENTNASVIISALNAFSKIESSIPTNTITDFLYSSNKKIITAAIRALEKIATPAAIARLSERMGTDTQLDLLIIDSFARIQDRASLAKINETLVSHSAVIRNYGKTKLINIGAKSVPLLISNLLQDDPDLLIHSLNALGLIGDKSAIQPIRKMLFNEPADPNVRFAAYEALGMLPIQKEAYALSAGLSDPVENVRMAAIKAINKNYNTILSAGLKNIINSRETNSKELIKIITDAEADNIFTDMIDDAPSRKMFTHYLKKQAHKDIRKHFETLLYRKGYSDIASKLHKSAHQKTLRGTVAVVDDSRMILNVYKTVLYKLGYESELFEFPSSALESVTEKKPDLLITDLNMPEITGIELVQKIRKKYNSSELPIIMVTTQNETQDNEVAKEAGVNLIMQKPFDENTLGEAIKKVSAT